MNRGVQAERLAGDIGDLGGRMDGGGETSLVFSIHAASRYDAIADLFDAAVARIAGAACMFSNAYDPISKARLN